jgi:tRNA(adenine34) deaminase
VSHAPHDADHLFMGMALDLADESASDGEVPIGCVVVLDGKVLSRGRNRMERLQDASAHAEMEALRGASAALSSWRLDGCVLYATLEPCPMCAGAILNSRVARVVYGARDERLGACDTHFRILAHNPIHRVVEVSDGVRADECAERMRSFFRSLRTGERASSRARRLGAPAADS